MIACKNQKLQMLDVDISLSVYFQHAFSKLNECKLLKGIPLCKTSIPFIK